MSWEELFPGTCFDEYQFSKGTQYTGTNYLKFFVANCAFQQLRANGAVRIEASGKDISAYVTSNRFESCASGNDKGGSLYIGETGESINTRNTFYKSGSFSDGQAFYTQVSAKSNYKNHVNETEANECGHSIYVGTSATSMAGGYIIMILCNITKNKVEAGGGYGAAEIQSDSIITCVNIVENSQSNGNFNYHSNPYTNKAPKFTVTSCNYIKNNGQNTDDGYLIYSEGSDVLMKYCTISGNNIPYIFWIFDCKITLENSYADNTKSFTDGDETNYPSPTINNRVNSADQVEKRCTYNAATTMQLRGIFKYYCNPSEQIKVFFKQKRIY